MQAAELLRQPYYTDEPTEWVLNLIARRVEQLALIADDRAQLAARPLAPRFRADGELANAQPPATA